MIDSECDASLRWKLSLYSVNQRLYHPQLRLVLVKASGQIGSIAEPGAVRSERILISEHDSVDHSSFQYCYTVNLRLTHSA